MTVISGHWSWQYDYGQYYLQFIEAGTDLNFLADLEILKNKLPEQYIPRTEFRREKENTVISDIVNEVSQRIQTYPFDPNV